MDGMLEEESGQGNTQGNTSTNTPIPTYPTITLAPSTLTVFPSKVLTDCYLTTEFNGDCNCVPLINTHAQLEVMRESAYTSALHTSVSPFTTPPTSPPPKVIICGSRRSGRHTVHRTLLSYAMKVRRSPLALNLDPGRVLHGLTPAQGTVGAKVVKGEWCNKGVTQDYTCWEAGSGGKVQGCGVCWFFGLPEVGAGKEWYKEIVGKVGDVVEGRGRKAREGGRQEGIKEWASGWIGVMPQGGMQGEEEGIEPEVVWEAVADLGANVVICLDWNVGFNYLRSRAEAVEGVKVIKIPKSGGVERTGGGGKATASGYFRGVTRGKVEKGKEGDDDPSGSKSPPSGPPYWTTMKWSSLTFLQVSVVSVGSSMLPMGQSEAISNVNVREIERVKEGTVAAVMGDDAYETFKANGRPGELCKTGVRGFVVVGESRGEDEEKTVRIGTNVEGGIPGRTLIVGEGIEWVEGA